MKKFRVEKFFLYLFVSLLLLACAGKRVRMPKVKQEVALEYPLSAQLDQVEGNVLVGVFVNRNGRAETVELVESSGSTELDSAALNYASTLSFQPATIDNKPIEAWMRLLLRYKLDQKPFEKEKWLYNVKHYRDKINNASDSLEYKLYLKRLYVTYQSVINYTRQTENPEINHYLKKILSPMIIDYWAPVWNDYPAAFTVYDEFLHNYPHCFFIDRVREDFIQELSNVQYHIQLDAADPNRPPGVIHPLLELIEKKINQLEEKQIF